MLRYILNRRMSTDITHGESMYGFPYVFLLFIRNYQELSFVERQIVVFSWYEFEIHSTNWFSHQ